VTPTETLVAELRELLSAHEAIGAEQHAARFASFHKMGHWLVRNGTALTTQSAMIETLTRERDLLFRNGEAVAALVREACDRAETAEAALADARDKALSDAAECVPANWLDPILHHMLGNKHITPALVETAFNRLRERISALKSA
jgi:hypothetical protein